MTTIPCTQCGSINFLSAENCQECGAELHYLVPAGGRPTVPRATEERKEQSSADWEEGIYDFAPEIGSFDGVSSALNPTITIFKDNFWLITKIVIALFAPLEVFKVMAITRDPANWQTVVGPFLMSAFCGVLIMPSVIYALVTVMRTGVAPKLSEIYVFGLSKIWKVIVTAIMAGFLTFLGFICLIIPGIILSLAFTLIYPLATLENLSATETLKRSYRLTKGHKWNIFLTFFVVTLLVAVVNIPVSIAASMFSMGGEAVAVWPQAVAALLSDFLGEATTVLSLVIYIGILKHNHEPIPLIELPPPPPTFVEG